MIRETLSSECDFFDAESLSFLERNKNFVIPVNPRSLFEQNYELLLTRFTKIRPSLMDSRSVREAVTEFINRQFTVDQALNVILHKLEHTKRSGNETELSTDDKALKFRKLAKASSMSGINARGHQGVLVVQQQLMT